MSAPSKSQSAKEACLESVVTYLKGLPKPNLLAILATSREELAIDLEKVLNTARKKEDRADVTAQLKDMAYQVRKNECQFIEGNKLLEDLGIGAKRTAEELAEAAPTPKRAKHIGLDISAEVFDDHLAPSVPALLHIQDYGQKASSTAFQPITADFANGHDGLTIIYVNASVEAFTGADGTTFAASAYAVFCSNTHKIVSVANAAQSSMEAEALGVFNALRTLPSKTYILVCSEDAQLCKLIALTTYLENEQRSSVLRLWKIIQWRKGTTTSAWTKRTLQAWAHKTTARAAKAAQEKRMESLRASLEPGVQFPELIILPANSGSGRLFYGPQSMIWDTTALRGTSEVAPAAVSAGGHHSDTDSTAGDGLGWATERSSHYDESGYDAGTSDDDDRDDGNGRAQTTPTPPDQHTQSEAPPPPANQDVAIVNHAQQPTAQEPTTEPQPAQSAPPSPAPHPHQVADIDAAASADASWDEWSFLFEDVGGI